MVKWTENSIALALKLKLSPKWLVHAFGIGGLPDANPRSADR